MKKLAIGIASFALFLTASTTAMAAPNNSNKAANNPNVVAYYKTGIHAIPSDPITYVIGTDLVMMRGNSGNAEQWGNAQQWYTGADNHGIHSVWNISKDGSCSKNWVLIKNAYPNWGDYLTPGVDYCVHNNSF